MVKIRSRDLTINENLKHSVLIGDNIFYIKKNEVFKLKFKEMNPSEKLKFNFGETLTSLHNFNNNLLISQGSNVFIYDIVNNILKEKFLLKEVPVKILVSEIESDFFISFLYSNGDIQLKRNDSLEDIRIIRKGELINDEEFVDFVHTPSSSYFLTKFGSIYESEPFIITRRSLYKKPLKMVPEPIHFINEEPKSFGFKENKLFICYSTGYEVYKNENNILWQIYCYKGKEVNLFYYDNVFCVNDKLLIADEAPEILINDKIKYFYGTLGIAKEKVYFIDELKETPHFLQSKGLELIKETDPSERVKELFEDVYNLEKLDEIEINENDLSEKSTLLMEKHINEFRSKILDKFTAIYIELNSLNESFADKEKLLDEKSKELLQRAKNLDQKKDMLTEKMNKIDEELRLLCEKMYLNLDWNIDCNHLREVIENIRQKMKTVHSKKLQKYIRILKMQQELLIQKLT